MEIEELIEPEVAPAPVKVEETATAKEMRELRQRVSDSDRRAAEAEQTARFWSEKAASASHAPAPPVPVKQEEAAEDMLEIITSGDPKRFKASLKKMGLVDQEEVQSRITQARAEATNDAVLERDYPALADNKSVMFQETAKQYQALVRLDPSMGKNNNTSMIAARMAAAELRAKGIDPATGLAADGEEPEEDEDAPAPPPRRKAAPAAETETERVRRVGSQSTRRSATPARDRDDDNELSKVQKEVVARLRASGANITEESYKARLLKGTRMKGLGPRD